MILIVSFFYGHIILLLLFFRPLA